MDPSVTAHLAIALAIGLIIGLERGWHSRGNQTGLRSAGFRTFAFAGLLGGVSALLGMEYGWGVLAVAFAALGGVTAASYILTASRSGDFGITTELALLATFALAALAVIGFRTEAIAAAVVATVLLGYKRELHGSLRYLERSELRATLQLLLIAAVILPLLPNRGLGPWEAVNPRHVGLFVLLIAGISYVGYFAIRILGARVGLLATAVLGALTSSTAVTVAFARMARRSARNASLLGAGITGAAAIMAVRVLVEVVVVDASVLPHVAAPLSVLVVVPLLFAVAIARRAPPASSDPAELPVGNPLQLGTALTYAAVLSALFLLIEAAEASLGSAGVYTVAALSGVADVDAISISLADAAGRTLTPEVAAVGITIAAVVNTVVKAGLALVIGGRVLFRPCALVLLAAAVASTAVVLIGAA